MERERFPYHVAIIMDGNGRWAKARRLPRVAGHQAGMATLETIIDHAKDLGIRWLSVYAFSTENWKRSFSEVQGLMGIFRYFLRGKIEKMHRKGARVRFAGKIAELPQDLQDFIASAEERTKDNTDIDVILCINYGGRQEVLDAIEKMRDAGYAEPLDESSFRRYLWIPDAPDPDLLIRTGGEFRISNFWLWQSAYAELYFSDVLWPDFGKRELERALDSFAGRDRRYGSA